MTFIAPHDGLTLLGVFGFLMIALVWLRTKHEKHADGFLVADRQVSAWRGGFSLAISWAWAPAFFVCALQAYNLGLAGIFWFAAPNILVFFLFIPFALRLRRSLPEGYTLAEYMVERFGGSQKVHIVFIMAVILSTLVAFVANANAGGLLLHTLSGIDRNVAMISMVGIAFIYSLMSGLRASVFTDVIQMMMVLLFVFILVPWVVFEAGGLGTVLSGLGGIEGEHGSVFHPGVAFAMGIPTSVVLITGPFCDQMFIQRVFAIKQKEIGKALVIGGLSFGIIPLALSLFGFIAVTYVGAGLLTVDNSEMAGPTVVAHLLPQYALFGYIIMLFAGLCSTIDSALCAMSSIGAVDVYKRYVVPKASDEKLLLASRVTMILAVAVGLGITLLQPNIIWVFMIGGSITASTFFPVILALFWDKLTAGGVFWAILLSLTIGVPYSIYANVTGETDHIVYAALISTFIPLIICLLVGCLNKQSRG